AGAFFVTPVADPEHIVLFGFLQRTENLDVCRLVKCPHFAHTKTIAIDLSQRVTEGEDTIEQVHMETQQLARMALRAMMSVMQKRAEPKLFLKREYRVYKTRIVPFMDEDDIGGTKL